MVGYTFCKISPTARFLGGALPGPLRKKRGYVSGFGIDGPLVHGLRSIDTPTYNESDTQTGPGNPKNGQRGPEQTQERQEKGWKQEEEGGNPETRSPKINT